MTTTRPAHPLFEKYTLEDLAVRTQYSLGYLLDVRMGKSPANKKFRLVLSAVLQRPESELFTDAIEAVRVGEAE